MPRSWEDTFDDVKKRNEGVRRKMFVDAIKEKVPALDPDLAFLTPEEVLEAMKNNPLIENYHQRLIEEYEPEKREIGLLFPDADRKPWTPGETTALSYRHLYASLRNLKMEERVSLFAISPLLGIVPREWFDSMPMYDASGMQSFMVRRRGLSWNADVFKEVIDRSAAMVAEFLKKHKDKCDVWHVIYRGPSVHQRIFEEALEMYPTPIWPHKTRKSLADSYLQMRQILSEIGEG